MYPWVNNPVQGKVLLMEITITWVNDTPSASGKTIKVYVTAPGWEPNVTHYAWVPVGMKPNKFDIITAPTVKLGEIESSYEDKTSKKIVALKKARRQVSFFGLEGQPVILDDGPELAATEWVDRRTPKAKNADNAF